MSTVIPQGNYDTIPPCLFSSKHEECGVDWEGGGEFLLGASGKVAVVMAYTFWKYSKYRAVSRQSWLAASGV